MAGAIKSEKVSSALGNVIAGRISFLTIHNGMISLTMVSFRHMHDCCKAKSFSIISLIL